MESKQELGLSSGVDGVSFDFSHRSERGRDVFQDRALGLPSWLHVACLASSESRSHAVLELAQQLKPQRECLAQVLDGLRQEILVINLPDEPWSPTAIHRACAAHAHNESKWLIVAPKGIVRARLGRQDGGSYERGHTNPYFLNATVLWDRWLKPLIGSLADFKGHLLLDFNTNLSQAGISPEVLTPRLETFMRDLSELGLQCTVGLPALDYLTLDHARCLAQYSGAHMHKLCLGSLAFRQQTQCVPTAPTLILDCRRWQESGFSRMEHFFRSFSPVATLSASLDRDVWLLLDRQDAQSAHCADALRGAFEGLAMVV
jgi:hypothetical protein